MSGSSHELSCKFGAIVPEGDTIPSRCVFFETAFSTAQEAYSTDTAVEIKTRRKFTFGLEFDYFPHIQSISFEGSEGGVPWFALQKCLQYPGFAPGVERRLTAFSYTPFQWREFAREKVWENYDTPAAYNLESLYLRAIVLSISSTVQSLTLPVETAPLREMAAFDWPRLRVFTLVGQYSSAEQSNAIADLLPRMSSLRDLTIRANQVMEVTRPQLASKELAPGAANLRSLSIAYPNPSDPLFSLLSGNLTRLSLRDSPRQHLRRRNFYGEHVTVSPP
ncbi:hypothetical protein C8Q77DRAFT_1156966 [Trametes polyzona]|nr:hypothetical protein C8Q77DRAFT_1156966 [Trametes polyzona]